MSILQTIRNILSPIKFIDIYSDNPFEPEKFIKDGYIGVMFKGGQGGWADVPLVHPEWWNIAKSYGLKVGWYWVCDSRYRSATHITCMKSVGLFEDVGELGLWIDMEKPRISMTEADYWLTPYAGYNQVVDFAYLIRLEGVEPNIYTGLGAYELIMRGAPKWAHDYLAQSKLWTAQYPWLYVPGVSKPTLYGSWKEYRWWQYREGPDINLYNGTLEQFELEYGKTVITIPEIPVTYPTGDNMIVKGTAKAITNLKPTAGGVAIAQLPVGGWVFGEKGSTDLTGFTHYYKPDGTMVELGKPCKATLGNLTIDYTAVESTTPPADPPDTPKTFKTAIFVADDGSQEAYDLTKRAQ